MLSSTQYNMHFHYHACSPGRGSILVPLAVRALVLSMGPLSDTYDWSVVYQVSSCPVCWLTRGCLMSTRWPAPSPTLVLQGPEHLPGPLVWDNHNQTGRFQDRQLHRRKLGHLTMEVYPHVPNQIATVPKTNQWIDSCSLNLK